jgi:hypothetical protein
MAGTLKPVRFILAWQTYRVGETITPNAALRDWLIGNGYCESVTDPIARPAKLSHKAQRVLAQAGGTH